MTQRRWMRLLALGASALACGAAAAPAEAGTVSFSGGQVLYTGTSSTDAPAFASTMSGEVSITEAGALTLDDSALAVCGETVPGDVIACLDPSITSVRATLLGGTDTADASAFAASSPALTLDGGTGGDTLTGGAGDDVISARDGQADTVTCGDGTDTAFLDALDTESGCESTPALPTLSIGDVTVGEGAGTATLTVTRTGATPDTVTAAIGTAAGTATGADFGALSSSSISIPGSLAATATETVTVPITSDALDEADETFTATLTSPGNAVLDDASATVTITDDDATPSLSIGDASGSEGGTITFPVTLSAASGQAVTVDYATPATTADFSGTSGTLTFSPGQTSKSVVVTTTEDTLDEADETFTATLSNATNATLADATATGTITDDDPTPTLSIGDAGANEGEVATFTVSLSAASGRTVTVGYGTSGAAGDITPASGTLTFAPGDTSETISVQTTEDALDEADDAFVVTLSGPTNATLDDDSGTGTITDDDPTPALSVGDDTASEGDALSLPVTLSAASGRTVTVAYAMPGGGADYTAASGTLTFAAGETSKTITVPTTEDALDEPDQSFTVTLSSPTNATLADNQATATITDDDPTPTLAAGDATVAEGGNGLVTVTLSAASERTVTVGYTTANGTAVAPADYAATSGTLTFTPGDTSEVVVVDTDQDAFDEDGETLGVVLSSPVNATLADDTGTVTITDDDATPSLTIGNASVGEGEDGASTQRDLVVTLSAASGRAVTVDWTTVAGTATAGADFVAASGTLTIPAFTTSATIPFTVLDDALEEAATEQFTVVLSNPTGATIADGSGAVGVFDDDDQPVVSIDDAATVAEGAGTVTLTVRRSGDAQGAVSVPVTTQAGTATAGSDFTATVTPSTVTFVTGETEKTVSVPILDNGIAEGTETFQVKLGTPTGAVVANGTATVTITDDDGTPTLSLAGVTVTEGTGAGTTAAVLTLTRTGATAQTVTAGYVATAAVGTEADDFLPTSGTATIPPGETTTTITVPVVADAKDERTEQVSVTLANPQNATIAPGQGAATVTITDDDAPARLDVADVAIGEGDGGAKNATVTVTRVGQTERRITASAVTGPITGAARPATSGADYSGVSTSLTFLPGGETATQAVVVPVVGDTVFEGDEVVGLRLNAPDADDDTPEDPGVTLGHNPGVLTIADDDAAPALAAEGVRVTEDGGTAVVTVTKAGATQRTATVAYATEGGSAVAGADFTPVSGTLSFGPTETVKAIAVPVAADAADEPDEAFDVVLGAPAEAALAAGRATVVIADDDAPPVVPVADVADVKLTEGSSSTKRKLAFPVTLSAPPAGEVTVRYRTFDGRAKAGADFDPVAGTLVFPAGQTNAVVEVPITGDKADEPDERFTLVLSSPSGVVLGRATGIATIADDDAPKRCVVPKLAGRTLSGAKARLKRAGCATGKVTRQRASRARRGRVVKSTPKAGSKVAGGTKVRLVVGR